MTRPIRVKQKNKAAIIAALVQAGFTMGSSEAPLSEQEYYKNSFSSYKEWSENSIIGMAGIETSGSGHQAHKILHLKSC